MKTPINIASMLGMLALLGGLTIPGLAFAVHPCVDIVKQVSADGGMTWHDANTEADAVSVSHGAIYQFTVKRCDYDGLYEVLVMDDLLGIAQPLNPFLLSNNNWNKELGQWTVDLNAEAQTFTVEAPDICDGYTGTLANTATVTATGEYTQQNVSDTDTAWIRCEPVTSGGGEGCTPGYWKQPQHFDSWPVGLTPDTSYAAIFGRTITVRTKEDGLVTDPNLLQALSAQGGQVNTAARHSTAAYLNSLSGGVSYDLDSNQVIANLQNSVDNSDFGDLIEALVSFNEQGCPLN